MVLEDPVLPFFEWFVGNPSAWGALLIFIATLVVLAVVAVLLGLVISVIIAGPSKGGEQVYRVVANGLSEMFHWSPRRVFAVARLAAQESFRKRVWIAIVVYLLILLFAGWFISGQRDPAKIYNTFVLTSISFLGVFIGGILSVFSLPDDFKSKTIYTIVTKPVRSGDIVLGRILGFSFVGTVLLILMGGASYVFVTRSLQHSHELDKTSMQEITNADGEVIDEIPRFTTSDDDHRHDVIVTEDGKLIAAYAHGHEHKILEKDGELSVSAPLSTVRARVPKYGKIYFYDPNGNRVARGVSVGKEWKYRSFILGGSQAAAVWTFDNVDESVLDEDGEFLPVELIVRVFRTYKGDIETPVQGTIQLRNPETELKSQVEFFASKDALIDSKYFPRKLSDSDNNPIDLLDDLVSKDGKIEVLVQCVDPAQYFGFAQADCFIRRPDSSPSLNFFKAIVSIWAQMVIVISIAVASSTFLSGPIALLFTASLVLLGYTKDFFLAIARLRRADGSEFEGGGPIEALVRTWTQMNLTSPFPDEQNRIEIQIMKGCDRVIGFCMEAVAQMAPDFSQFNGADYVANGFSIPWGLVLQQFIVCIAFVLGATVIGYFFLRNREIAK